MVEAGHQVERKLIAAILAASEGENNIPGI
jgi:hypothetical protein